MAQERFIGDHEMPDVILQWQDYFNRLDVRSGHAVLDVGCHEGDAIALLLAEHPEVGRVVGLDRDQKKYEHARARFSDRRVQLVCGDAVALPFEDRAFDRVYCAETLEWTDDPEEAVKEMHRVLRSDGQALVIHTDFDTQVFASDDLSVTRAIVHSFTDGGRRGTIGRDLHALCSQAGFSRVEPLVYVLVSTSFASNRYPRKLVEMMRGWLVAKGTFDRKAFDEWTRELEKRDLEGRFFYSVNRNGCLCWR